MLARMKADSQAQQHGLPLTKPDLHDLPPVETNTEPLIWVLGGACDYITANTFSHRRGNYWLSLENVRIPDVVLPLVLLPISLTCQCPAPRCLSKISKGMCISLLGL
jgi:hypothetical protein